MFRDIKISLGSEIVQKQSRGVCGISIAILKDLRQGVKEPYAYMEFHLWQLNHFATYFAAELIAFPWHADSSVLFTSKSFSQNIKKVFSYLPLCHFV